MFFFTELKRRKVFRVAVTCAIVAWLIAQIVSVLNDSLNLPDWVDTLVILPLFIGFPIALILAWAYEVTPDGIKYDATTQAAKNIVQETDPKLTYLILALVLIVAGFKIQERDPVRLMMQHS
jgi:adenylate cyclase